MRGWGAIIYAALAWLGVQLLLSSPLFLESWRKDESEIWELLFGLVIVAFIALVGLPMLLYLLVVSFLNVTDPIVRLDARRQKVWMWTGKGAIEIDWSRLTPRIESSIATAYATVKVYRGQYAELGPDGKPRQTHGLPHVFQCGEPAAAEEAVLPSMEYLRSYMENGPQSVHPPAKLLSHRPRWYAMVNFFGLADSWVDWKAGRGKPDAPGMPMWATFFAVLLFPVLFPLQVTNWLALTVAPRPKWPKALREMHDAELKAWRQEQAKH